MEQQIKIPTQAGHLEGILDRQDGSKAVVITHPHPLYGGDMNNSVVQILAGVFKSKGYTTLRFNFRGVGGSSGSYDNGVGEQEDLRQAVDYITPEGKEEMILVGYSFGSWIIYNFAVEAGPRDKIVMVSPPVSFIEFQEAEEIEGLALVVVGDQDDFADLAVLKRCMPIWNKQAKLEVIEGADHFYSTHFHQLSEKVLGVL